MAFSLNRITLIGNLGKDCETRFTTNNVSVTSFSLATVNSYKGKDDNWVNETTWHNVVGFNLSDFMKGSLLKGKKFYVEGRISKRDYTDKDGIQRYFTDVIAEKMFPLETTTQPSESNPTESHMEEPASARPEEINADDNGDLPF